MVSEPGRSGGGSELVERPCPGHRVAAACNLPSDTHNRAVVKSGTLGEIVRTPAYFSTTYSIKFFVNDAEITLHRINRHEFRMIGQDSGVVDPGYPPPDRYPQPRWVAPQDQPAQPDSAPTDETTADSPGDRDAPSDSA